LSPATFIGAVLVVVVGGLILWALAGGGTGLWKSRRREPDVQPEPVARAGVRTLAAGPNQTSGERRSAPGPRRQVVRIATHPAAKRILSCLVCGLLGIAHVVDLRLTEE